MKHEPVRLAKEIDWGWIDEQVADCFSAEGRPATETRFMIGILLLKQIYGLSDEGIWERWVHDPYFQYFTGEIHFQHKIPHQRSGLSHWRGLDPGAIRAITRPNPYASIALARSAASTARSRRSCAAGPS